MATDLADLAAAPPDATRSPVAHNALLNFLGLAVPLAVAFFVMPVAARHLGPARFGLLGLTWAVTEYLTFFDLGLGRALVKFVADSLHRPAGDLNEIVSLSIVAQVLAGIVGGGIFTIAAPFLVQHVFSVPPQIADEATAAFRIVGLSIPAVLLISGERAVLEGAQRFDLSATIKMLTSISSLGIPAIGAVLGATLPVILSWMLVARIVVCGVYVVAIRSALPDIRWVNSKNWNILRRVLSFGGWVLVSNTVNPLLVYFDRFALGSIIGLAAVGFYTAPYEGVTRLLLIPVSLFGSLLPALTSMAAAGDDARFTRLSAASERVLIPVMAIPVAIILVFAPELLRVWLGPEYAAHSTTALRWLAVGVFANSVANPLFVTLYARNRPDLPARFHVIELAMHVPLTVFLIRTFGTAGAAVAWTTRVVLDLALLLWATARISNRPMLEVVGGRVSRSTVAVSLLFAGLVASKFAGGVTNGVSSGVALTTIVLFAVGSWRWIFRDDERRAVRGTLQSYRKSLPRTAASG